MATIHAFGPFHLDTDAETLFRGSDPLPVGKRAVDLETSIRLSPRDNRSQRYLTIGLGHFFARRSERAAEMLGLSLQENSRWRPTLRHMASCLAHMGRLEEAQQLVKQLRAITPIVIPSAEHWRIREDREYFLDGLQLAVGNTRDEVANR